ncbi:transferrin-binding protein-like solute binding protein [Conchiformibius kuhniae]|uniref:Transferrin-binding protein-like solute binding protein n=1 Tax=Conchiformibius kuhniae TaxID=211502 RepID=A0A8T9MT93_9NEIS
MQKGKTFAVLLSAVLLAACGSSGGGSRPHTGGEYSRDANPNNTPVGKVALGGVVISVPAAQVGTLVLPRKSEVRTETVSRQDEINTLVLNGKRIALVPAHFAGKVFVRNDKNTEKAFGNNLRYARYGWYAGVDEKQDAVFQTVDSALFFQGQTTPAPVVAAQRGKVRYTGLSLSTQLSDDARRFAAHFENLRPLVNVQGSAVLDVDFDAKSFRAEFRPEEQRFADLPAIHGVIDGNELQGRPHAAHHLRGAFFGPKAEEAAGLFTYSGLQQKAHSGLGGETAVLGTFGVKKP